MKLNVDDCEIFIFWVEIYGYRIEVNFLVFWIKGFEFMLRMVYWIIENFKDGVDCEGEDGDRLFYIVCFYGYLFCV